MRLKMSSAIFPPNCAGQNVLITSGSTSCLFSLERIRKMRKICAMYGRTNLHHQQGRVSCKYYNFMCVFFSRTRSLRIECKWYCLFEKIYINMCNYLQLTKWIISFLFLSDNICMKMRHGTHILFEQEKKIGIRCLFVIAIKVLS